MDKTSMLYWYPFVKDLPIPQPKTKIIELTKEERAKASEIILDCNLRERVRESIQSNFTLPVFLRTDSLSDKHNWEKSCFYADIGEDTLSYHLLALIEMSVMCDIIGLPVNAIVIREYIPMDTKFTAFRGKLPIGSERRYFIKDGKVIEHFPYWSKEAISKTTRCLPEEENWEELLQELNTETPEEIELLTCYANSIAGMLDGYWSVDFCKGKDGKWYFIDAAEGEKSWHPKELESGGKK
ncbi:MAG: hypothetical protein PHX21_13115 [bacterium]|nr:hypothetical protein [bacterium]